MQSIRMPWTFPPLALHARLRVSPALRAVAPRALLLWLVTRAEDVLLTLTLPGTLIQQVNHWYFWDGGFYWLIARFGYISTDPRLAAYFPLYPALVHLGISAGLPGITPALLVSNLALLAALVVVGLLGRHEGIGAWAPMLLLAVSPLGVFLAGIYAESLFVALTAGVLLAARSQHWRVAAFLLALAVITRPFGLALAVAVAVAYLLQHRGRISADFILLCEMPAVAFVGFMLILTRQYHDPLAFLHVESTRFGRAFLWPWQTVVLGVQQFAATPSQRAHMLLDLSPVLVCAVVLLLKARRWPVVYSLTVGLVVLSCLLSPVTHAWGQYALISAGRYTYAAVPVLLPLGEWLARAPHWLAAAVLAVSFCVQIGLTVFVMHGGWLV